MNPYRVVTMKKINLNPSTMKLAVGGVMIAVATILSIIQVFRLPYGGSITLCSMVPIMLIGYLYGVRWGMLCGLVYGAVQAILGVQTSAYAGQTWWGVMLILFFDYVVAFSALGLAGIFAKKIKNTQIGFGLGIVLAGMLRLTAHFVSGFILFGQYAEWYFSQENFPSFGQTMLTEYSGIKLSMIYSVIYNGSYMIPETIISLIAGVLIISVVKKVTKKYN